MAHPRWPKLMQGPRSDRSTTSVAWDLVRPKPYDLVFRNSTDVICLLFGAIDAQTGYDGARPAAMRFEPLSIAFHPNGGEVAVRASQVSGGFVAFTFPPGSEKASSATTLR
jgi:hypothetical protein